MFSGLVFSVVFGLMYWYRDLLSNKEITIMDQSLINHFDLKLCLTVAVLSMLLIVVNIPWWRSHPIHENRATESICTEPCNPLLRATKSMKRATSTY